MSVKIVMTIMVALGLSLTGLIRLVDGHSTSYITVRPVNTGQTYVPSLRLFRTPIAGRVQFTTVYRVAIFPLADYSHQQSFVHALAWGENRAIVESLTDRFISHGISVALQEDVEALLIAEGLLRPPQSANIAGLTPREQLAQRAYVANTPEFELLWGMHNEVMRDELTSVVQSQDFLRIGGLTLLPSDEPFLQGVTDGLPRAKVVELGRLLDVDLIIRGRILEAGFNPSRPVTSVMQIRLYAQETKTGELFWSNRGEFEVTHRTGFGHSPADQKGLFDRATREVVEALMVDFFGER